MAAKPPQNTPKMAWRKCKCPIYDLQDGVCGCSEFWQRKARSNQSQSKTGSSTTETPAELILSSETPSGPLRETCFFWYHGTCRRGDQCNLAHELHITWPIPPPRGFVHFESCDLPLCPLRHGLLRFLRSQEQEVEHCKHGTPLNKAAVSCSKCSTSRDL
jgi:hypothetical protein